MNFGILGAKVRFFLHILTHFCKKLIDQGLIRGTVPLITHFAPDVHMQNIFSDGELKKDSVCRKFQRTAADGKNYSHVDRSLSGCIDIMSHRSIKSSQIVVAGDDGIAIL